MMWVYANRPFLGSYRPNERADIPSFTSDSKLLDKGKILAGQEEAYKLAWAPAEAILAA